MLKIVASEVAPPPVIEIVPLEDAPAPADGIEIDYLGTATGSSPNWTGMPPRTG